MADTAGGSADDVARMPLGERLSSKIWKARLSAYEELARVFSHTSSDEDPVFDEYARQTDLLQGMALDANAAAQEKGVECLCAFVKYGGSRAGRTRMDVLPGIADKCLGSMRTGTRKAAQELVLLYAEQEDAKGCDGIIGDLCDKLTSKQPKVVAANVSALALLVQNLGGEQVNVRLISPCIPRIFAHADKNVRAEGTVLAVELHRVMGGALAPVLSQLKDIQVKELERQFSEAPPANAPARYLASNKARYEASEAPSAAASMDDAAPPSEAAVDEQHGDMDVLVHDPYETSEPVHVLSQGKISPQFFSLVAASKWQERMEAVESLYAALKDLPRIQFDPELDAYVQALQLRVQKDVNINVVLQACRCLSALAQGLRKDGASFLYVLPTVLERLKERKPTTVDVLAATLDALFLCGTFSDILEPVVAAAAHKNPAVKAGTLRFLARCLQRSSAAPSGAEIKTMASMLVTSLGDGAGDVRDAAAYAMGTLLKLVGERGMAPFMEQLDDIKRAKVQEEASNVTLAGRRAAPPSKASPHPPASASPKGAPRAPSAPVRPPTRPPRDTAPTAPRRPAAATEGAPPVKPRAPARPSPQKPAVPRAPVPSLGASSSAASRRPPARSGPAQPAADEALSYRYSPEDGAAQALELLPESVKAQLASSSWKERLEGAQSLVPWIRTTEPDTELVAHLLVRHPGWKESNFQVMNAVFQAMQAIQALPSFGRSAAALTIPPLCEKLGDIKLKATAGETLMLYAEACSFGFVLAQGLPVLSHLKAPKAQADALLWVNDAVLAFGLQGVNTKALVSYTVAGLKSANAAVRANATAVFGTLARFVGRALLSLVSDVTPQLMATLEAQVASAEPAPAPTRTTCSAAAEGPEEVSGPATPAANEAADDVDLDDLVPRVAIETVVPSVALQSMGDSSWKVRKEAMETVLSSLQSHARLQGQGTDLVQALKPRLQDTNLMVRTLALELVALLARGLQKHFDPLARALSAPVVQVLADAKAPIRAAAAATLDAMVAQVQLAPLVPGMGQVLDSKHANPMLRQDLFQWLVGALQAHSPPPDLAPLVPSVVASLDDRSGPVRKGAQALLPMVLASVGYKALVDATGALKGASRATALPLIEEACSEAARLHRPGAPAAPAASGPMPRAASRAIVPPSSMPPASMPAQRRAAPTSTASTSRREAGSAPVARVRPTAEPARPKASAVSRTLSSSARAAEPAPPPTPFLTSDSKYKAARERASRTPFVMEGVVRARDVAILRQQMETCCVPTLVARLFSQDHHAERDYLQGLEDVMSVLTNPACAEQAGVSSSEVLAQVCANTDVLLKYACMRLLEKNTSVALKCFELLGALLDTMSRENTPLGDAEAQALILTLILRTGDAKSAFREAARDMLQRVCVLFPPSRLFQLLLEHGLSSKNARTRSECLAELGCLLARHGLAVCTPAKSLPLVARLIGDRDPAVRGAALGTLVEAYKLVGEGLWRLVGPLPAKDESLLEERLKRTSVPSPTRAGHGGEPSERRALPSLAARAPRPSWTPADKQEDAQEDVAQVRSEVKETSMAGLKSLQVRLPQTLTSSTRPSVVQALLTALQRTSRGGLVDHRYVKHVLQTLLVLLDSQYACAAPLVVEDLAPLLHALLRQLMLISALDDDASQTLAKQLNAVVLRVLSTCPGDAVYAALFQLLTDGARTLSAESDEDARFVELVVKCLWKVARKLPNALETKQVHGAALLLSVEQFLQAVPPAEWGRRAREHVPLRDIPLITATNVLKQMTDVLGEGALALTDTWEEPENSHVYRYLLRLLYGSGASREGESTASTSTAPASAAPLKEEPKESAPVRRATSPSNDALTAELRSIFDRISQKDQSRAAIRDLYEYQKRHPSKHASIERSLQNTGPIFQRYIKRALANHAAEDQTPAPTLPSSSVDARLAELKAKFRREPGDQRSTERIEKRMSMSTEALRSRLAAMRTDDAGPGPT